MIHGCPGSLLFSFSCLYPLCNTTFVNIKKIIIIIQVSVAQSGVNGTISVYTVSTKGFHKKAE